MIDSFDASRIPLAHAALDAEQKVGMLPTGAHTTWTISKPLRKVWITLT